MLICYDFATRWTLKTLKVVWWLSRSQLLRQLKQARTFRCRVNTKQIKQYDNLSSSVFFNRRVISSSLNMTSAQVQVKRHTCTRRLSLPREKSRKSRAKTKQVKKKWDKTWEVTFKFWNSKCRWRRHSGPQRGFTHLLECFFCVGTARNY